MQQRAGSPQRRWYHFESQDGSDPEAQRAPEAPPAPAGIAGRGPRAGAVPSLQPYEEDAGEGVHAAIGLPRSLGVPPAGSRYRRSRVPTRFDVAQLPAIERASVALFDLISHKVPPFLRSHAIAGAAVEHLKGLLSPDPAQTRKVTLDVKDLQSGKTASHASAEPELTIGSHASNLVHLPTAMVSRRHVRLVVGEGGVTLVDQGSSNGTYLRGERVQPGYAYPVQNNETFTVPGYEVTVRWPEKPAAVQLQEIKPQGIRAESVEAFRSSCPRHGVVAAVRIEPGGLRLGLELDAPLAHLIVQRVLGGSTPLLADGSVPLSPLGEVDKGVLELVLVRLLDHLQRAWGKEAESTLHLERLYDGADPQLGEVLGRDGPLAVLTLGIGFDQRRDTVRLALPIEKFDLLVERYARTVAAAGETPEELYHRFRDLVGLARVELAWTIGAMKISRAELRAMEIGAICFPDALSLRIGAEGVEGKVAIQSAHGRGRASITGRIVEYDQAVRVEVETLGLRPGGKPEASEAGMAEDQAQEETGEGVGLLDDVPMTVVVELGRLSLTVRDLARLRRGQVLELGRGAEEPVNLVVDGHLVGTGKLVNVEGEIGVQILDLMR